MEFIVELFLEILIEGTIELGTSKKVWLPLRIIALAIFLLIYGTLIGVLAMVGLEIWQAGNEPSAIMVFGIDVFIAVLVINFIVKKYVEKYRK